MMRSMNIRCEKGQAPYFFPSNPLRTYSVSVSPFILPKHRTMDEDTLKTPTPKCRLSWSSLLGAVKKFCRFWIWSETECKTPAEYGLQHNSTPPPPAVTHCQGRGGCHREGREGQQNTSIVPPSMGATVHKLGRKYQPRLNVSPFYKIF